MIKWKLKDLNEFCGDPGQEMSAEPVGTLNYYFKYPKNRCNIKKNA
jgi:hypothetical protein